jgi:hypothetical protein
MRLISPLLLLMLSQDVLACAVCTSGEDISTAAYLRSTIMMSLVPLIALGGVAYLLYRNMKRAKAKE